MDFRPGDIVLAVFPDSKKKGPIERRPLLVLEVYGIDCRVVAITTLFNSADILPHQIRLPINSVTNLWKDCVVSCDWSIVLLLEEMEFLGRVDAVVLARAKQILLNRRSVNR